MQTLLNKLDYDAKINREKRDNERRKNLLILILRYLINMGLSNTAFTLQEEANLDIDKFDIADNIDLNMILTDYEEYFEIRFNKKPLLVKKILENNNSNKLPSIKMSKDKSIKGRETPKLDNKDKLKNNKNEKQNFISLNNGTNIANGGEIKLEIVGQNINPKKEKEKDEKEKFTFNDQRDSILLKPIPDNLFGNNELRELAGLVRKEIIIENPNVKFDDIVGLEVPKNIVHEALLLPMKYPQYFTGILEPWKGILLFGPPGTGKTLLAKAVASELRCTFFNISASTIVSKWRGDSEKIIKVLFDLARYYQPSTIFLDEIDSIMNKRNSMDEHEGSRRMKTELLIQLDGLSKRENERVFLLAASNLPWDLDQALLRRLEKRVIVTLPDLEARVKMLKKFIPVEKISDLNYDHFAKLLDGYSGSDIRLVCKEAMMKGVRRAISFLENSKNDKIIDKKLEAVNNDDLQESMEKTRPASFYKQCEYLKWMESFGSF